MYYSERINKDDNLEKSTLQFWNSYLAYLRKLIDNEYLFEKFVDYNEFEDYYTTSKYKLEEELLIKLGLNIDIYSSVPDEKMLPDEDFQLDVVEFFFQHVSKPLSYYTDYRKNISFPETFDIAKGRYEYTVMVNSIFSRNKLPYRLDKGKVIRTHDNFLDKQLMDNDFSNNEKLKSEVKQAIELYFSRNPDNIKVALTTIANSFELAKTLAYPDDKRRSITKICKDIASDNDKLVEIFNGHFLYLTDISNNCDIRHKETGKIIIEDIELQEYLFYTYYNAINLIVKKLELE